MPFERTSSRQPARDSWDVVRVHAEYGPYLWLTLQRMGIAASDLQDTMQETLIVVHRNIERYDPEARMSAWLFGICRRVAAGYRARAHRRYERLPGELPERSETVTPEQIAGQREARELMEGILSRLDPEKRAVFVMFEVEQLDCSEIAECVGVPVGTVYSRLHSARREIDAAVARLRLADGRRLA